MYLIYILILLFYGMYRMLLVAPRNADVYWLDKCMNSQQTFVTYIAFLKQISQNFSCAAPSLYNLLPWAIRPTLHISFKNAYVT